MSYDSLFRPTGKSFSGCDGIQLSNSVIYQYGTDTFLTQPFDGTGVPSGWTADAGAVTFSGGMAHLTSSTVWKGLNRLDDGTFKQGASTKVKFRVSDVDTVAAILIQRGTWGTSSYKRWGLYVSGGWLKRETYEGTTGNLLDVLPVTANVWYELTLEVASGGTMRFILRRLDDISTASEIVQTFSTWNDPSASWSFAACIYNRTLDVDSYTHLNHQGNIGQRVGMTDGSGSTAWKYDLRGRMVEERKTISGAGTYTTAWEYNSADLVTKLTYPGGNDGSLGEWVTTSYLPQLSPDVVGSQQNPTPYVQDTQYDAAGRMNSRLFGNNVIVDPTYYAWTTQGGRLQNLRAGPGGNPTQWQNLSYTYDAIGNIQQIQNSLANETANYTYDALNRLDTISSTYGENDTLSYDASTGNLASKDGQAYIYPASGRVHGVTSAGNKGSYAYDANGNMATRTISGTVYNLAYDQANAMVGYSGGSVNASFVYDGDGNRVKGVVNGTTTYYVSDLYEVTGAKVTKYYAEGDTKVALRVSGSGNPDENGLFYLLTDHLGGTNVILKDGVSSSEMRYKAWGETRFTSGLMPGLTPVQYTGQRAETQLGILYYKARWYDPYLNRWIQPDSIIPDPYAPQDWDRYSYVRNNPVNFNDPSGHMLEDGCQREGCEKPNRKKLINLEAQILRKRGGDALENFSILTEYSARLYDKDETTQFVYDLTCVINGYCSGPGRLVYQIGMVDKYPNATKGDAFIGQLFFKGKGSWRDEYFDNSDNQMYHFWFYAATSYFDTPLIAEAGNLYHDPVLNNPLSNFGVGSKGIDVGFWIEDHNGVSLEDKQLGTRGIELGLALRAGLSPDQVGQWILFYLGKNP
jgi:RHS repeat-associated protein